MKFEPNWVSPPGESIKRFMETNSISHVEISELLQLDNEKLTELLLGDMRIDDELAINLAEQLGGSQEFWITRDVQYLEDLRRLNLMSASCPIKDWLNDLPINEMQKRGLIGPREKKQSSEERICKFFGCETYSQWKEKYRIGIGATVAFFRTSIHQCNYPSTMAWLRVGEIQANEICVGKFDKEKFKNNLVDIKKLTFRKKPEIFWPILQKRCAELGVALVSYKLLPGCAASGATWLNHDGSPIIMMSFKHLSEDHFWFTFFHEAAHVFLHGETHISLEGGNSSPIYDSDLEYEANTFAQDILIPRELQPKLRKLSARKQQIIEFAKLAKTTPGIVVGQLQKSKLIGYEQMNHLKRKYSWKDCDKVPRFR